MASVNGSGFRDLYHGAAASRVNSIRVAGLFPPKSPRYPGFWAMLTSSWEDAAGNARRQPPSDGAVIEYRVPEDQADTYLYPPMPMGPHTWYTLRKPLPGSMIHRVDIVDPAATEPR